MIAEMLKARTSEEWRAALEAEGVPCGPINALDEVFADPQVEARGMRFELDHPRAGRVPMVASPMRFSDTPLEHRRPPPLLGEHTDVVLGELLGLDAGEIARLRDGGVI